jgi:adenylate cyclase
LFSDRAANLLRRNLRMGSGLILFVYIGSHLLNHALGLISLHVAETGMELAVEVWYSTLGTLLLYGAAATHFFMALWAVYERRTFRLPPAELLRIALGFTLPILLIGHAASTRLAYEVFGLSSDYTRVISNIWASGSQGFQLGLMAPGWLHGCMGLHFAFNRRPIYRRLRFVLFAAALLLPVLSALGFIAMGRELATNPAVVDASLKFLSPEHAVQRLAIAQWKDNLLNWYFCIIGAAFIARQIRNLLERRGKQLVTVSYPGRNVRIPRGWSVLEASRSFHLAHASMCGGRARCSTCRVRVTAGGEFCPPVAADERATLRRIGAPPDVRLACQLRPQGNIAVTPLVRTARPIYRQTTPRRSGEQEIAVLYCDVRNRADLAIDHLPEDVLYILTLFVEGVGNAVRAHGGHLSFLDQDSICALFGVDRWSDHAAQRAVQAAGAIAGVIADLNNRSGRQGDDHLKVSISIHAGRAAVGEIGSAETPMWLATGTAMDVADELRAAAARSDKPFAISEQVYQDAELIPPEQGKIMLPRASPDQPVAAYLLEDAPVPSPTWTLHGEIGRGTVLKRLWAGG